MTITRWIAPGLLVTLCLALSPATLAADSDCAEDNGKAQCTGVIVKGPWGFGYCGDFGNYLEYDYQECIARGGTWDTSSVAFGPLCVGNITPITESNFASIYTQVEQGFYQPCQLSSSGTGWGATVTSSGWCPTGGTVTVNGIESRRFAIHTFFHTGWATNTTCSTTVIERRYILVSDRDVGCPKGYVAATSAGKTACKLAPPCKTCLGNPMDVGNGAKLQRETDYKSAAPGGLQFSRHYYSAGYFSPMAGGVETNDDYWRHGYSASVIDRAGNAYLLGTVKRPDGNVKDFALNGSDIRNDGDGKWRLERLTSGATLSGWRLTTPESDVELYDAQGRLASITMRAGFVHTLAYGADGKLATIADSFGRTITLAYVGGKLASMTDPAGRATQYGYDGQGRLSTVTTPASTTRTYLYEDATFPFGLTGIVDERGTRLSTYTYNADGQVTSTEHAGQVDKFTISGYGLADTATTATRYVTDAFGTSHTYNFSKTGGTLKRTSHSVTYLGTESATYDANGNPLTKVDRNANTTTYVYDPARNLETSRTEASGTAVARTITTQWHPTFQLPAQITEPSGVAGVNLVTDFTYDAAGNVTRRRLTAGVDVREWNYTVNSFGQVLTVDGPRLDTTDVTTYTYFPANDPCIACRGQVATITNAAGHVTTFTSYNGDGLPLAMTDANGIQSTFAYHTRGWLASRTTAGETTSYEYDAVGSLAKVTLPDGSWVHYAYDAAARLIGIDDSLGNGIEYTLDARGNRLLENVFDPQDQLRRTMQRVYDGANRLQREIGASGQFTQYAWDGNLNVTSVVDPLFNTTANLYDAHNRLTRITDAAAAYTYFTYDAKDRLKTVQDPRGLTTTYTYNGLGDLLAQASPDTGSTSFTYNPAGNALSRIDARGIQTTYGYDSMGRVLTATVADGAVSYEYDNLATGGSFAKGRLTRITDPSGTTLYAYDGLGRVTTKTQNVGSPVRSFAVGYAYSQGRPSGMNYPSGRALAYGYNAQGQVTSISVDGTPILAGAIYYPFGGPRAWIWGNGQACERGFDMDGRVSSTTLGPSTGTYADLGQAFAYDVLNRLKTGAIAAGQSQSFNYDANGNRTGATINAATTTYNVSSSSHRLTSLSGATTKSFAYDNAGNTTQAGATTFVYDGRGRMKQAGTSTYLVNGLGQRVAKTVGGVATYFAYDEAGRLLGEYDAAGVPIQEIVWLGDLPVAAIRPKTGGFDIFYVWADHLGTPRAVSDVANVLRWEWGHLDPFGNHSPNANPQGAGVFAFNLRFPGQYFDQETGTHYNYFRDFDPSIGRYIQSDPIGLRGGINTYGYVGGRPLTRRDPSGLKAQLCCKKIPWLPAAHCFVNEVANDDQECKNCPSKTRRVGLQGPPPWGNSEHPGAGQIRTDDDFDKPGESRCGDWNTSCEVSKCIDRVMQNYPDPSQYSAAFGPNSNSFASLISRECGIPQGDGPWPTPGWGSAPAGPAK